MSTELKPVRPISTQDVEMMRLQAYMDSRQEDFDNFTTLLEVLSDMKLAHIHVQLFTDGETIVYEAHKKRPIGFGTDMKGNNDYDTRER